LYGGSLQYSFRFHSQFSIFFSFPSITQISFIFPDVHTSFHFHRFLIFSSSRIKLIFSLCHDFLSMNDKYLANEKKWEITFWMVTFCLKSHWLKLNENWSKMREIDER
jgi:hypothetical protein